LYVLPSCSALTAGMAVIRAPLATKRKGHHPEWVMA
jgi:hypothetical protein